MVKPFDPEEDWHLEQELGGECFYRHHFEQLTLTGKLRRFHNSFDSSLRAVLQDCLYRINDEKGVITFEILCPNETVQRRLYKKREKIRRSLTIVGKIDYYALCVDRDGLSCQVFETKSYLGGS